MKKANDVYNKVIDLWNFLSGKKTLIGATLHFIVYVTRGLETYFGLYLVPDPALAEIDTLANWIITVGLIHKGIKLAK